MDFHLIFPFEDRRHSQMLRPEIFFIYFHAIQQIKIDTHQVVCRFIVRIHVCINQSRLRNDRLLHSA